MTFADALSQFQSNADAAHVRDQFAPLAMAASEYERYLATLPAMTDEEEVAYARCYAEAEAASARFAYAFPYLDD